MKIKKSLMVIGIGILAAGLLAGCTTDKDLERMNQQQAQTIQSLQSEIGRLNQELEELIEARQRLAGAKSELERRLKDEMEAGNLSVTMEERGLVVTVLDRVLFNSGKAKLKTGSHGTLGKVAEVLSQKVSGHVVYVEGHTDNEPIKYSGWRSNWELSTARATEVIHYFINEQNFDPKRLVATGYGEFQPVMTNDTTEGRMKNRRVEIVISPKKVLAPMAATA